MRLLYLDIETTGLDSHLDQVIELGAVWDDGALPIDQLPTFRGIIKRERYTGEPYALQMHAKLFKQIAANDPRLPLYHDASLLVTAFNQWLIDTIQPETDKDYRITVCGKNVAGFDYQFLLEMGGGLHRRGGGMTYGAWCFDARVLDVGSIYWDPQSDVNLPSLDECLRRSGITKRVPHNAVDDCLLCVEAVRAYSGWWHEMKVIEDQINGEEVE